MRPPLDAVAVPLAAVVDTARVQGILRALCARLGLAEREAAEWTLGFSDLLLTLFPERPRGARVRLTPVRKRDGVGLELAVEHAGRDACLRGRLGHWIDECEVAREPGETVRLVARKWHEEES